jgi:hypothetical protein
VSAIIMAVNISVLIASDTEPFYPILVADRPNFTRRVVKTTLTYNLRF